MSETEETKEEEVVVTENSMLENEAFTKHWCEYNFVCIFNILGTMTQTQLEL
jgi:hypothetical protein